MGEVSPVPSIHARGDGGARGAGVFPHARSLMIAPPEVEGLASSGTVRMYADVVYTRVRMACERYE